VSNVGGLVPTALRERLRDLYWIGGGSGAGKSTLAHRLAAAHGFHVYDTDHAMADHGGRVSPERCPLMAQFIAMDLDKRWVTRSPEVMLETFHWFRGEAFDLIVDDLLGLPRHPPVIAEGFRLLPHLVAPLLAERRNAVWLIPTPDFRENAFERRRPSGAPWTFINNTSAPDTALRNLLERDRMFTNRLSEDARRLGLHIVEVHRGLTEDDVAERATAALGL
jgi:hypothetical protein